MNSTERDELRQHARRKVGRLIVLAPLAIVGLLLFMALGGWLVQLLWNALLPALFGWPQVTFWQALGLLALCRILFGRIGSRGSLRPSLRGRLAERLDRLTPEERERLRQRLWHDAGPSASGGPGA